MCHKVLLVDDDPSVLTGLSRMLHDEPFEVVTALSGNEALSILEETPIDVVVSDHDMPGMTGVELLSRVHTLYPDTVRFMLTGKATLDVAIEAINKGAISRFLTKPCNGTDLVVTIRHALTEKDLTIEARGLLKKVREQSVVLQDLERSNPGITRIERDEHGATAIDDVPENIDDLIRACRKERRGE